MPKRAPALDPRQVAFTFDAPRPARMAAALAGLDRRVASAVAQMLNKDPRSREEIAGAMSALLGDDVSRWMLDGYASEGRETHNISAGRLLALVAATDRFDLLGALLREIGASLLVGDEINAAHLGHLHAQRREIDARIRSASANATPIERGRRA